VPRAVLFGLGPGVIGTLRASLGVLSHPGNLANQIAGAGTNWAKSHYKRAWH
jgi:hypothetical protein